MLSSVVFVAQLSVRLRSTLLSVPGGVYGGGKDGGIEKGLRPSRVKISKIIQTFENLISNIFWSPLTIGFKIYFLISCKNLFCTQIKVVVK